jgi:hypothetical protein
MTPEFASDADARDYGAWFRAKVEASLADPRPTIPHDEAMARIAATIAAARRTASQE